MTKARIIRRKPAARRKDSWIRLRVTEAQKARLTAAADAIGLSLSAWLRLVTLQAADDSRKVRGARGAAS